MLCAAGVGGRRSHGYRLCRNVGGKCDTPGVSGGSLHQRRVGNLKKRLENELRCVWTLNFLYEQHY